MNLYFQKYDLTILRLTQARFTILDSIFNTIHISKAGLLINTANFNQFTWEMYEKILDIRYFYFGKYLINFLIK